MDICNVARQFDIKGNVLSAQRYGDGHINVTYLVETDEKRYILQKVNTTLFTDPDKLMHNISTVSSHIRSKATEDIERCTLNVIKTKEGKPYFKNEDGCYRVYDFIEDALAHNKADEKLFYYSAVAFGKFANDLSDFDASQLYEILPSFHDTTVRFANFEKAIKEDKFDRVKLVKDEIEFFINRKNYCGMIVERLADGRLPLRVTHNDTKLNNVMLDNETGKPVAVIDMDTVMPGSVSYDFGDSIRFGCNTGAEDEKDLSKVHFSLALYKSYAKGYTEAYPLMTSEERKMLPYGSIIMTYECGMRFLTDYLQGDTYFRTSREGHNLDRCRTQMRLVEEMEENLDKMSV